MEQKLRRIHRELQLGALALVGVVCAGTLWYWLVEGWRFIDALYMTVITLATVGFMEVQPLGDRGRAFTVALIVMGVVAIGYIANRFADAVVQGYLQEGIRIRQRRRVMNSLNQHYILCGFGRTGRQIALEFATQGIPFVVVDADTQAAQAAQDMGYMAIQGDATLDETLQLLSIEKAICVVTALPSDAENLYTVLSAKTLNPQVRVIARASNEEAIQKLQRVGADAVVSPYITGGKRMAASALRPQVMDFVDGILTGGDRPFYMEEFCIDAESCPFVGQTLRRSELRSRTGALVLAIHRQDRELIVGPTADTELRSQDILICMGTAEQLQHLNQLLSPLSNHPLQTPLSPERR
nr:potassium channel protein [Petrachloros mirabilis]